MNLILCRADEVAADGRVVLDDARAVHIREVLRATPGQRVRLGVLNGARGLGTVEAMAGAAVSLIWEAVQPAPPPPRVDLLLALPRPKVMRRLWAPLASLGVGRVVLTNAARVERNYFDTHWLDPAVYTPLLTEGLAQAGDTRVPDVQVRREFRPLVEDELSALFPGCARLLAHPSAQPELAALGAVPAGARAVLALGPEGGWTPFELDLMDRHGFTRLALGWRTLRSDTACVALVALVQALLPCTPPRPLS